MTRFQVRWPLALIVLGALIEPLGHELAYALRYGLARAAQVQSAGSHSYFPPVASMSSISVLAGLTLALLAVTAVRLALGRRSVPVAAFGRTFVLLAATQCALFSIQETLETLSRQASPDLLTIGLLALLAQLPMAAVAAWLIARWRGYLALAPEALRVILAIRLAPPPEPLRLRGLPLPAQRSKIRDQRWYRRRGPPLDLT